MKIKKVPKKLNNLPDGYCLDSEDKWAIKKYRNEIKQKLRRENKVMEIYSNWQEISFEN